MAGDQNNTTVIRISRKLREIERYLAQKLGPQVLDYLFLFTKTDSVAVEFHELTKEVETEIQHYIELAGDITESLGVSHEYDEMTPLHKKFLDSLHDMYLLRYIEAKKQFAEYQIVRVPTRTEQTILNAMDVEKEEDHTVPVAINFQIPGAFVIDEDGNLDVAKTIEAEKKDYQIASYLSTMPMLPGLKKLLLQDLEDITIYGNVPLLLSIELMSVHEAVLQYIAVYLTRRVYSYIYRKVPPDQAIANVEAYFKQVSIGDSSDFPPGLEELGEEVTVILDEELRKIEQIEPQTRATLVEEYKEILLFYINDGLLLPDNYYDMRFRQPNDYNPEEERFNVLFDLYLYNYDGKVFELPFETYNIDYTQETRQNIFYAVTGGLENPEFTLEEYLSEVT